MRLLLASLFFLSGCVFTPAVTGPSFGPNENGVVVIRNNHGGNVQHFLNERARLERIGAPVEIRGFCNSACVVFVTLPTACMGSGAFLGFHRVSGGGPLGQPLGISRISATLRGEMRRKYDAEWSRSASIVSVNRSEALRLDPEIQRCESKE